MCRHQSHAGGTACWYGGHVSEETKGCDLDVRIISVSKNVVDSYFARPAGLEEDVALDAALSLSLEDQECNAVQASSATSKRYCRRTKYMPN